MSLTVEFHFDFASPNAYLSQVVLPAIESRTGVAFSYVPVLLGGVFKDRRGTHGSSPGAAERTGVRLPRLGADVRPPCLPVR